MFYILATTMYVKVKSFERKYITLLFFLLNHTFAVFLVFWGFFYFCLHAIHAMEQKNRLKKRFFYSFVTFWP